MSRDICKSLTLKQLYRVVTWTAVSVMTLAAERTFSQDNDTTHVTVPMGGESSTQDGQQFFFDARSTGFTKDGTQQVLEGDVIAIGAKILITADKVTMDEPHRYLVAEGHVILLTEGMYITGDKIQVWGDTADVKVTSALLVINDSSETERIANEVLGYTSSEIEFEAHRKNRKDELEKEKLLLRSEARERSKEGRNVPESVIQQYARFLEQQDMMSQQENPAFAQMSEARRKTLKKRRDFWEQARLSDRVKTTPSAAAYFRMSGDTLEKRNGNDFSSVDGLWTPCHCEKDESPAWALRSSKTEVQPGGYATFQNTVLEIKGMPVLYLPWLRLPIKDKRQSGLLPPSISSDAASGSVYSQPLYLDLGADQDVTLKTDVFERRGTKIEGEYRYQARQYSGFELKGALMQDRLWSAQRATRQDVKNLYLDGLDAALDPNQNADGRDLSGYTGRDWMRWRLRQREEYWNARHRPNPGETIGAPINPYSLCVAPDPDDRLACRNRLISNLRVPNNERRGMFRWRGQQRLSGRLSFVATGELYSDRQYNNDLYVPESFQAGFDTGTAEKAIQPARTQLHYDGRNYYLGLGSALGDSVIRNDRYEGFQTPAIVKARSRWFHLGNSGVPIYGNVSTEQYRIARNPGTREDPESSITTLPNAWWRRANASLVAPLSSSSAVQVDHFSDLEARYISFDDPKHLGLASHMQSMRTGLRFQLPIDGKRPLPDWLGGSNIPGEDGARYIQHLMNWAVTFTARPNVVRRGPYGEPFSELSTIDPEANRFMITDSRRTSINTDDNIKPEDHMDAYQLITFETSHRWKLFNEIWKRLEGKDSGSKDIKGETKPKTLSYDEQARRELLYSMDHPVKSDADMFSEDQTKWFISRYQLLETDYQEPVTFSANISYDRLKEVRRQNEGGTIDNRPWSEAVGSLTLNAARWQFSDTSQYSIYDHIATRHALSLTPPGFFSTNINLGYVLTQSVSETSGKIDFKKSNERTLQVVTSLTKPLYTTYTWGRKDVKDDSNFPDYQQKIGFVYSSPSRCWGMGFSREKGYGVPEEAATYVLQLNIIFMGQIRDLPDMSPQLSRQIDKSS